MNICTVFKKILKINYKCKFFSSLDDKCISEKDYLHAINVWNVFKMNTMGNYHDVYLKKDISLLADAFKKFINTCLEYYGLDPCHHFIVLDKVGMKFLK